MDFVNHPFITRIELWLLRRISKSPRIGMVAVKEYGTGRYWVVKDKSDPTLRGITPLDLRSVLESLYRSGSSSS